tara:strand:- start:431 stop:640 length:210 start_codon:yes stop_codon:yes gene_type:complete
MAPNQNISLANHSYMEALIKIPLGAYLDADELDRFAAKCAEEKETPEARITNLIRADLKKAPPEEEAQK